MTEHRVSPTEQGVVGQASGVSWGSPRNGGTQGLGSSETRERVLVSLGVSRLESSSLGS